VSDIMGMCEGQVESSDSSKYNT